MNLSNIMHGLTTTATCIGFFVMCAWVLLLGWLISIVFGELRFNRLLRRTQRDSRAHTSSTYHETHEMRLRAHYKPDDGFEHDFTTAELPIHFRFHHDEDEFPTEETGAVFDISERYPNEFA